MVPLALAAVPGLVLWVALLVIKTLDIEDGAAEPTAFLLLLLDSLLPLDLADHGTSRA